LYGEPVVISAALLIRPQLKILLEIITCNISSGSTNTVDDYSVDREKEKIEFEIDLMAELHVTSYIKTYIRDICALDSSCDRNTYHQCYAVLLVHRRGSLQTYPCSRDTAS